MKTALNSVLSNRISVVSLYGISSVVVFLTLGATLGAIWLCQKQRQMTRAQRSSDLQLQNMNALWDLRHIAVTLHERHGVPDHRIDCLLYSLFMLTSKETSKVHITGALWGESPRVASPHKGLVMWKLFSCHDVIMWRLWDPFHKPHNALDKYSTTHHFVTKMCAHKHISVSKWCIVDHETVALWDLCNMSILIPHWRGKICLRKRGSAPDNYI